MVSKIHLTLNAAPPLRCFALLKQNKFWVGLSQARIQFVNTSNFANGIYNLAIVSDGKHVANKKLVINH
jgi:hypothetical protein